MCRRAPRLGPGRPLEGIQAIELREVAPVDRDVIAARRVPLPVVLDRLGQDDRHRAVKRVVCDRRHLVHVLAGGIDGRVLRIELRAHHRVAPVVGQQRHDGRPLLRVAAVDELALVVVGELHVLRRAEGIEGPIPLLRLDECKCAGGDERDADQSKDESKPSQSTDHGSHLFRADGTDFQEHCRRTCGLTHGTDGLNRRPTGPRRDGPSVMRASLSIPLVWLSEMALRDEGGRLGPALQIELRQDAADVVLHRLVGKEHLGSNLLVRLALSHQ